MNFSVVATVFVLFFLFSGNIAFLIVAAYAWYLNRLGIKRLPRNRQEALRVKRIFTGCVRKGASGLKDDLSNLHTQWKNKPKERKVA